MPIGALSTIVPVTRSVLLTQAKSVLDLGVGFGINGAAVRNWMDNGVKPFRTRLVGVEGFPQYRTAVWDLYDEIHTMTIQRYLKMSSEKFDAILMTDVIEHFTKEEAYLVVSRCKDLLNPKGCLVIVTPGIWIEQGAYMGNELERHKSLWTPDDFRAVGFAIIQDGSLDPYGYRMIVAEYLRQ